MCIAGDIDQSTTVEISQTLAELPSNQRLVLDLSETSYLDSAGVAMLDSLRQRTDLAIILPARAIIRRVLQITAFDQLVPTFSSIEELPA